MWKYGYLNHAFAKYVCQICSIAVEAASGQDEDQMLAIAELMTLAS